MSPSREERFAALRVRAESAELAELACAEAWSAGATGVVVEERDLGGELTVYAPRARADAVAVALRAALGERGSVEVEAVEPVAWDEAWKEGIGATEVSPRLVVHPSFVEVAPAPGRAELIVEPGQAFGTGSHASTQLALEAIDALYADVAHRNRFARVLDVGTGSGILALAALVLGARSALGFDLDPLSPPAARAAAAANRLRDRFEVFTGPIGAIRPIGRECGDPACFDLVVANLLKRELLPIAEDVSARLRPEGVIVVSGLLDADVSEVVARFASGNFRERSRTTTRDADDEIWVALTLARA